MKVLQFTSKTLFSKFDSSFQERVPEEIKFFVGVLLTVWAPALFACYAIGQAQPFYLMLFIEAFGIVAGVWKYLKPSDGFLSCVPARVSDAPTGTHHPMDKAA